MGRDRWDYANTRASYSMHVNSIKDTKHYSEVFKSRSLKKALDPKGVLLRESCDSEHNPTSNAIIIGLDVTGSMGIIAHEISKSGLGKLFEGILERKPVTDPHIMFMGIGDIHCDTSPFQVSQFEAGPQIIEQLNDLFVEGGGGGNNTESYDLAWYFAGTRTSIDCFTKRNKKGYLFTIGDEEPPTGVVGSNHITNIFGNNEEVSYSTKDLLKLAQEKYHVFHIIVEEGSYARLRLPEVTSKWREVLGKRAISLSRHNYLPEVILSVMDVSEGKDPTDVIQSWEDPVIRNVVAHAFRSPE